MRATRAARDADRRPDRDWDGPLNYRLLEGERDLLPSTGAVFNAGDMRHSLGLLRRMRDREGFSLVYGHDAAQLRELRSAPEAFA